MLNYSLIPQSSDCLEEKDEDIVVSIGKRLHVPAPHCSKLYVSNILGGKYFSKRVQL